MMEFCSRLFSHSRVARWVGLVGLNGPVQGTNLMIRLYWRGLMIAEAPRERVSISFGTERQ